MSPQNYELNLQLRQFIDASVLVIALWLSHLLRFSLNGVLGLTTIPDFSQFIWLILILLPFAPLVLELHGFYDHILEKRPLQSLRQILTSMVWLGCLVALCLVFLRLELPSRAVALIFVPLGTLSLLAVERLSVLSLKRQAENGALRERIILAGTQEEMDQLQESLLKDNRALFEVKSRFVLDEQPLSELIRAMHEHSVTRVIFVGGRTQLHLVEEAIQACDIEGVEAWLLADFIQTRNSQPVWSNLSGRPVLVFSSKPGVAWTLAAKRVIDIVGSGLGMLVLSPLFLIVVLLIKRDSPGDAIFKQARGGQHGYPFTMYKFRTMYTDAEQRRAELLDQNEMAGPVFKVSDDPRITGIGSWLRKTSIDELPQLWNVFRGEMSLVGPRPLPVYEVEQFENMAHRRRLSVKPGCTCLWQISGRNEVTNFDEWVRLDLEYIDHWSLWLDLRILMGTIPVVLLGRGAK